ncbi:MAG: NAD-dependent epimerase/dehydratase family protein [Acidiferrobacterales bacterium]|nr:NAD-dependent epimerase/dehydratase family protein [Acidiferrobacterales bacterium]
MSSYQTALITGGNGNIGRLIAKNLVNQGTKVIRFDVPGSELTEFHDLETVVIGDIRNAEILRSIFENHQPDIVYHLASLLSGSSEADLDAAWDINATSSFQLMKLAVEFGTQTFFFASTVASYGRGLPEPMHEETEQWPENFYGVTKVAVERLGVYFKQKHHLDFRCLRFPMVISPFAPATAVTAFPSHAIRAAVNAERFVFPVSAETGMSTLFLNDVIQSIVSVCESSSERLISNAYSLHAFYFTAAELSEKIKTRYPNFQCSFEPSSYVEQLLTDWPNVIIDHSARRDWGWEPEYDFDLSVGWMFEFFEQQRNG